MWNDSFDEIKEFEKKMRGMFDEFWPESPFENRKRGLVPPERSLDHYREPYSDVIESDKEVAITVDLPGLEKRNIKITTNDESVEISAERRSDTENKGGEKGYILKERNYSKFFRRIPLTVPVDSSGAKASYKNGVLEIVLPKSSESKKTIEVD